MTPLHEMTNEICRSQLFFVMGRSAIFTRFMCVSCKNQAGPVRRKAQHSGKTMPAKPSDNPPIIAVIALIVARDVQLELSGSAQVVKSAELPERICLHRHSGPPKHFSEPLPITSPDLYQEADRS